MTQSIYDLARQIALDPVESAVLQSTPIIAPSSRRVIKNTSRMGRPRKPHYRFRKSYRSVHSTLARIAEEQAEYSRYTVRDLQGPSRSSKLVLERWQFIFRASEAGATTTQIGLFLNRDHSAICYALKSMAKKIRTYR